MRTIASTFVIVTFAGAFALGCSSSSSGGGGTVVTDSGASPDVTADTNVGADVATDTKPTLDTGKPDSKSKDSSPTDTGPATCDPVAKTGCSGTDSKCTAIDDGSGTTVPGCVTPTGTVGADGTCKRASEDAAGIGHDDCAAGFYCSGIGSFTTPPVRHCRKYCATDTDCSGGQKCSILLSDPAGPIAGICVPTCTLFGTDCPTGFNCSLIIGDMDGAALYGTCRSVGTGAAGSTCKAGTECVADEVCSDPTMSGTSTCVPLCDTAHACTGGKTCKPQGSLPTGGGVCG